MNDRAEHGNRMSVVLGNRGHDTTDQNKPLGRKENALNKVLKHKGETAYRARDDLTDTMTTERIQATETVKLTVEST